MGLGLGLELGLESIGIERAFELATTCLALRLDDFKIGGLELELEVGERGLGYATMGLVYISYYL